MLLRIAPTGEPHPDVRVIPDAASADASIDRLCVTLEAAIERHRAAVNEAAPHGSSRCTDEILALRMLVRDAGYARDAHRGPPPRHAMRLAWIEEAGHTTAAISYTEDVAISPAPYGCVPYVYNVWSSRAGQGASLLVHACRATGSDTLYLHAKNRAVASYYVRVHEGRVIG